MSQASPQEPSAGPSTSSKHPWTEHRNAQGRVYWYHQVEKRSVWEKPAELRTARERAIDSTPWKEYQSGERKYYVHSVTKESSWTVPKELRDLFDTIPDEPSPAAVTPIIAAGGQSPAPASTSIMSPGGPGVAPVRPMYTGPPPGFASSNAVGSSSPMPIQPGFAPPSSTPSVPRVHVQPSASGSGGEEAFLHLLKEKNINQNWTWEQTMREIITEPLYKSLATLADRKAAFSKYINELKEQEHNSRKERAKEVEPKIREELQPLIDNGQIKAWLSYEGMLCRCEEVGDAWKALESIGMSEAKELWARMRRELREHETRETTELRHRNMDMLMSVFRTFEADVLTRWKDARQTVIESSEWKSDAHLSILNISDMITVFDEHMKTIEKEKAQELKEKALKRKRTDRQMRDWFREALQEGKAEGWLNAKTDFADVYARFKGNKNFVRMLDQPGSSALDLFFDVVDELEKKFKASLQSIEGLLAKTGSFRVEESTSLSEFEDAVAKGVQEVGKAVEVNEIDRKLVFEELQWIHKEEKRRGERKLRHLSEDLRYALKKLAHHRPELFEDEEELSKPWPEVVNKLQALRIPEWKAFDDNIKLITKERMDEGRQGAWDRFVKRQREKAEEKKASHGAHQSDEHGSPRRRRGEEGGEEERRRSSRRAGRHEEDEVAKVSTRSSARRERRAGELDESKEKDRKEKRRSAAPEDFEAIKRQKVEAASVEAADADAGDSEKEEGEV
ncbi:hypothetical protein CBS101457_001779 [Exobasidium rhododendri]|nr:hypothetical protein CBS101457_001779 [Exobasidium rhododendri]